LSGRFSAKRRQKIAGEYLNKNIEEAGDLSEIFDGIPELNRAVHSINVDKLRLAKGKGKYDGFLGNEFEELLNTYFKKISVSKLETYAKCPFMFFAEQVLKLEEIPTGEDGLDPMQSGSVLHTALEIFWGKRIARGFDENNIAGRISELEKRGDEILKIVGVNPDNFGDAKREIIEALDEAFDDPELRWADGIFKNELHSTLKKSLEKYIAYLAEAEDSFVPVSIETSSKIELEKGTIVSRADRVDADRDGRIRIIDFKSGTVPGLADIEDGLSLQLPLYCIAFSNFGKAIAGIYWGNFKKQNPQEFTRFDRADHIFNGKSGKYPDAEWDGKLEEYKVLASGIIEAISRGDFQPIECARKCAFSRVCRMSEYAADAKEKQDEQA
jgi:RecB family exonuclease